MATVVFIESSDNQIKKTSLEAVTYASKIGSDVIGVALGSSHDEGQLKSLGGYGASEVIFDGSSVFDSGDAGVTADVLKEIMGQKGADTFVFATSPFGSVVAGRLAAKLSAAIVTNVVDLPDTSSGYVLKRSIFTGKAFQDVSVTTFHKIIGIKKNVVEVSGSGAEAPISPLSLAAPDSSKMTVTGTDKVEGDVLLPEAERVVSAGRGLKGPENWGMIEDLAKLLGAATACSKPVSDMDWRPHHEHVGQTGLKIAPQLYIAIGISGAIQHLAGVNSSKVIVVVNKDPEAPFFKEADYGVVGDAFEVIPKLIEALKSSN